MYVRTYVCTYMHACIHTYIYTYIHNITYIHTFSLQTRRLVSDFGMLTAITTMVVVAYLVRDHIAVEVLLVPPNYSVSNSTARGWFINPFNTLSVGAAFGAMIPALLVSYKLGCWDVVLVGHCNGMFCNFSCLGLATYYVEI